MDAAADPSPTSLERSVSQHSTVSARSSRSATLRVGARLRKRASQPGSSASSIAPSDKSLTSFPSFSPPSPSVDRFGGGGDDRPGTARQQQQQQQTSAGQPLARSRARGSGSIVDNLTEQGSSRDALFEDSPLSRTVPGALHQADDGHIERLVARHGAVQLVRQISEDLAQRDAQIAHLRRRADERERSLRRIIRECGLSNLDLETRLREVESDLRNNGKGRSQTIDASGLSDLMSDAMQDTMAEHVFGETGAHNTASRANSVTIDRRTQPGKGTMRGWKDYLWGTGTAKKTSRNASVSADGVDPTTIVRSQSSMDRRPTLHEDLFTPPTSHPQQYAASLRIASRPSSIHSGRAEHRKSSTSLASMALRLVAGGTISAREAETRGRSVTGGAGFESARAASATSRQTGPPTRATSVSAGPKALMAMRRATPTPTPTPVSAPSTKSQAQELWETMVGSPPRSETARHESYGPVEMDAILPPESQPPTLTHIYNNNYHSEGGYLTDRFGFIYDQRRKKRQREAAQMARHMRKGSKNSRTEMLTNGRTGVSPNMLEDLPSPKLSVSNEDRPDSPTSLEERGGEDGRSKRWYDYLKIATIPTELLSHTPGMGASALEVMEAVEEPVPETTRSAGITPTESGLVPTASTTTAVDSETPQPSEPDAIPAAVVKEDNEPVKLLLQQLSEVHDSLQHDKTVRWNDFLRKVRAERKRDGEAAVAAAAAAAEARYERPAMILPETRVADGEIIGISDLGNKGKVGRAKWNEFKNLVLGGIPVAYRAKIWSECSGATALRVPGYYEDLVGQSSEEDDAVVVSQIQMDIHRTLTDNIFFRKGPGVQKLNEVLLAYSRRNKDVGYCQGMNLITANLLLILPSAEDAFWILTSMIENILPHGYYDHSLIASRADQQVLRQYVSTLLPKLSAHLDSLSIELEALTFQWFLSVFTDCVCAEALFRVWDVVLCTNDGSTFLFQVALALLKLNEGNLLQCGTPAAVYTYINHQMTEHAISIDGLVQASEGLRRVVRREEVEQRRDGVMTAERDMLAAAAAVSRDGEGTQKRKNKSKQTSSLSAASESNDELAMAEPRPME